MLQLSRLKVNEMRNMLIEQGHDKNGVSNLKRPALLKLLNNKNKDTTNDTIKVLPMLDTEIKEVGFEEISPKDKTQEIMNMFHDDELDNGNPRVEGLRRVAEEVIGKIIEEGCSLVQAPSSDNGFMACTKAWVIFGVKNQEPIVNRISTGKGQETINFERRTVRYEALADAHAGNVSSDFVNYLVACADTRAKGRCFRNALKLKRIVCAEELGRSKKEEIDTADMKIDSQQILLLERLGDKKNISITKLLSDMEIPFKPNEINSTIANLKSLSYKDALRVMARLNEYNTDNPVPNKLLRN